MKHAFIIIFIILFSLEVDAETISSNQRVGTMWEDVDSEKPETDRINTISFDAET